MKNQLTQQQTRLIVFLVLISIIVIFFLLDGQQWLNLQTLKQNRTALLDYTEQNYFTVFLASALLYIAVTALSLPGAAILSLALGLMFGRWMGTLLIVFSATIGATLVFLLARYLIADWAKEKLQQNNQAVKLMNTFQKDAFNYLLFLRLVPLFPFWLINLAIAFTPVSTQTYIITTLIGIIPGSFVFANLGQSLGQIENSEQFFSLPILFAFTLLGFLILSPVIMKYYKIIQTDQNNQ